MISHVTQFHPSFGCAFEVLKTPDPPGFDAAGRLQQVPTVQTKSRRVDNMLLRLSVCRCSPVLVSEGKRSVCTFFCFAEVLSVAVQSWSDEWWLLAGPGSKL